MKESFSKSGPRSDMYGHKGLGKEKVFRPCVPSGRLNAGSSRKHTLYRHMWAGKGRSNVNHGGVGSARQGAKPRTLYEGIFVWGKGKNIIP